MRTDDLLIGDVFATAAASVPDRTAVSLGDRSLTFGTLDAQANQMARALESLGIRRHSRVALWSVTTLDATPLFAAVAKLGAVFMPVNGLLGGGEAADIFAVGHPDLVVTDASPEMPADVAAHTSLDELGELAHGQADDPLRGRSGGRGRPPRRLLHQREHGPAQGGDPLPPDQPSALQPGGPARAARGHGVPLPALPHGGLDHRPPAVAGP